MNNNNINIGVIANYNLSPLHTLRELSRLLTALDPEATAAVNAAQVYELAVSDTYRSEHGLHASFPTKNSPSVAQRIDARVRAEILAAANAINRHAPPALMFAQDTNGSWGWMHTPGSAPDVRVYCNNCRDHCRAEELEYYQTAGLVVHTPCRTIVDVRTRRAPKTGETHGRSVGLHGVPEATNNADYVALDALEQPQQFAAVFPELVQPRAVQTPPTTEGAPAPGVYACAYDHKAVVDTRIALPATAEPAVRVDGARVYCRRCGRTMRFLAPTSVAD